MELDISDLFPLRHLKQPTRVDTQKQSHTQMLTIEQELKAAQDALATASAEAETLRGELATVKADLTAAQSLNEEAGAKSAELTADLGKTAAALLAEQQHFAAADALTKLQGVEIETLKASVAELEPLKSNPKGAAFKLAAEICAKAGVDALRVTSGKGSAVAAEPMSRAEFDALPHGERASYLRNGGKLTQ